MTEEKVNINMDESSRLDSRQCTEPSIKFHNKKGQNLFQGNKYFILTL